MGKTCLLRYYRWHVRHFIEPQLESLGRHATIQNPRHLRIFGSHIQIGKCPHIYCDASNPVEITSYSSKGQQASITIGGYCLITSGVKIRAANNIQIGDNCMFGADSSITDSDWHGIYNRLRPFGRATQPLSIGNNVWVGERAIIGKGVTIGENSVIGAGSVVTKDIPSNTIAAGNPAKVVKKISTTRRMLKREVIFPQTDSFDTMVKNLDQYSLSGNSLRHWLKQLVAPSRNC